MKLLFYLVILAALPQTLLGENLEEGLRRLLAEAKTHPTKENLMSLADEIKGNYRHRPLLTPGVLAATNAARDELCKIPGHARYFAEEIRREQEEVKKYATSSGPRVSYDRQRTWHFETLRNLPSPETILILGEFLSDDIDTPRTEIWEGSDWGANPRANSFFSSKTISGIGLRDPPVDEESFYKLPHKHLASTRAWWVDLKSGKRTFSFKGQKVEYRFKPDGTWETITMANPPDDGTVSPEAGAAKRPTRRSIAAVSETETPSSGVPWLWILVVMIMSAITQSAPPKWGQSTRIHILNGKRKDQTSGHPRSTIFHPRSCGSRAGR